MVIGVETIYFIDIVGIALTKPGIIINKFTPSFYPNSNSSH